MPQRNESAELARAVMELIDQGHRRISRRIDLTRVRVLGLISARGPLRPRDIAGELGLTASATSRHLTALEREGRVAVEADPADSRTFLVRVAPGGQAEIDATVEAGAAVFAQVIADWPDEDVATARVLITRLNEAWARRGDPTAPPATGPRWQRARRQED
ncbi:MarR family winged helix-turn-helix transcriptional regulator [Amycolatopsis sp. NPDC051371]|uniref:MarR family winged helix-turn-helix transcriptional regulator n=1 Tax=Amycolatopsis sp. NPDC051371 TaxID=3155800 RepID=UPI00343DBE2A